MHPRTNQWVGSNNMISPSFFQDSTCMQLAHCLVSIEAVVEGVQFDALILHVYFLRNCRFSMQYFLQT